MWIQKNYKEVKLVMSYCQKSACFTSVKPFKHIKIQNLLKTSKYEILIDFDCVNHLLGTTTSHFYNNIHFSLAIKLNLCFLQEFFCLKRVLDQGPEHRESKMTVLCLLIIIILIS
jgi:hypothetical protein